MWLPARSSERPIKSVRNGPGLHNRHLDSERLEFGGERFGHAYERPFRRAVDGKAGVVRDHRGGRDVHDLAALLGAQDLQRRTNDLQRAKEVSLEIARDRSGTEFLECAHQPVTRVIDDNIEPIKGGSSVSHHSFHPLRVW